VHLPSVRQHIEGPPNLHRLSWIEALEITFPVPADRPWWLPFPRTLRLSSETVQLVQGPIWDPVELRPHSVPAFYRDLAGFAARWPEATVVEVFIKVMAVHGMVPDNYLEAIYYITNQRCVYNPYGFSTKYGFHVHYIPRQPRTEPEVLLLSESDSGSSSGSVPGGFEADASSLESSIGLDTVE